MKSLMRIVVACGLLSVIGATAALEGCGSGPQQVEGTFNTPAGSGSYKWISDGTKSKLPSSYKVKGMRQVTITVNGKTYTISVCVAEDANNPNCIYINSAGCVEDGWTMYCANDETQHSPTDDKQLGSSGTNGNVSPVGSAVSQGGSMSCTLLGDLNFDPLSMTVQMSFFNDCKEIVVPNGLVNCTITLDSITLPADQWKSAIGRIPEGATISFGGSLADVAWNNACFGMNTLNGTVNDDLGQPHAVHSEIVSLGSDLPRFYVTIVDDVVQGVVGIGNPN